MRVQLGKFERFEAVQTYTTLHVLQGEVVWNLGSVRHVVTAPYVGPMPQCQLCGGAAGALFYVE